jgi:ATP-dependent exoDNAse (exonuclease V) beta subunit
VLDRPLDLIGRDEPSVRPGLVRPRTGQHGVVWWDPSVLRLGVEAGAGLRQGEILADVAGPSKAEYDAWRTARQKTIDAGRTPEWRIFTASEAEAAPAGFAVEVRWEFTERAAGRPSGPRFGTLVHALLGSAALDASREQLAEMAVLHGRLCGASPVEVDAAAAAAHAALGHVLLRRAREAGTVRREMPVMLAEGESMLEGVIDLAFEDAGGWTVVDFKTDADLAVRRLHYETQVRWYAYALGRLTGRAVEAWLLAV